MSSLAATLAACPSSGPGDIVTQRAELAGTRDVGRGDHPGERSVRRKHERVTNGEQAGWARRPRSHSLQQAGQEFIVVRQCRVPSCTASSLPYTLTCRSAARHWLIVRIDPRLTCLVPANFETRRKGGQCSPLEMRGGPIPPRSHGERAARLAWPPTFL